MNFNEWISPLLDYYKHEAIIFIDYLRPNKRGTFSVTRQKAQERIGVSVRYLYKVRSRAERLARLYEALVETGVN
jgi:hypothetical protein